MSVNLERLKVEITAETIDFKKKMDEVKAEAKKSSELAEKTLSEIGSGSSAKIRKKLNSVREDVQKTTKKWKEFAKQSQIDAGLLKPTKEFQKLQSTIDKTKAKVVDLKRKQDALGSDGRVPTEKYSALKTQMKTVEDEIDKLINKQIEWQNIGVDPKSAAFSQLDNEITETGEKLDMLKNKMRNLEDSGGAFTPSNKWKSLQSDITGAREKLKGYISESANMKSSGKDYAPVGKQSIGGQLKAYGMGATRKLLSAAKASGKIPGPLLRAARLASSFGRAAGKAGIAARVAFNEVSTTSRKAVGWLGKLAKGFGHVISKIPGLKKLTATSRSARRSMGRMGGMMGTLGITARFMAASFLIMGSIRAAKDGMDNLARYSRRTNRSLSMLKSSLIQLKNSLATAFAPILNYIAPVLNILIQYLVSATTAIAQFFAALTGQKTVEVAKRVTTDYAAGLDNAGGAADKAGKATDKANKSAEKYKRTLMGFDQINKLDAPDKKDKISSGGAGGIGAGLSPGDMFKTIKTKSRFSNLAKKFKDAWKKADFTEIGELVGKKINNALNKIPWKKIQHTSFKIAKSIATFLNGAIRTIDWQLVGKTLAEAINTVIEFAYTFVTIFDWKAFGKAIGNTIVGFFKNINWNKLFKGAFNLAKGLLEGITEAVDTVTKSLQKVNWMQIGSKSAEFIWKSFKSINWGHVVSVLYGAIGTGIGGIISFLAGLLGKAFKGLGKAIKREVEGAGGNIVLGLLKGMLKITFGIPLWIINNIFKPFIKGFMSAFGIHSPSTVMESMGVNLILGLFKGLIKNIGKVILWFAKLPGKIIKAVGEIVLFVGFKILGGIKTLAKWVIKHSGKPVNKGIGLVKRGWSTIARWTNRYIGGTVRKGIGLVKNGWSRISSWVTRFKGGSVRKTIGLLRDGWSSVASWVMDRLGGVVRIGVELVGEAWSALRALFGGKKAKGGVYVNGNWKPVQYAASGGAFGAGQMFIAREAGPELVGTIGGNTAVMNNDQIVASVSAGVYQAVLSAMSQKSGNNGEQSFYFQIDSETIAKAVNKGNAKLNRRLNPIG